MKCWKCGKETASDDGQIDLKGLSINIRSDGVNKSTDAIEYRNKQLGKYSDGHGECYVALCLECYIDGLLLAPPRSSPYITSI